jgi:transposase
MIASVLVAKYAWHLPLYRQAQMLGAQGIDIKRAVLAFWVGYAAAELKPVYLRLREFILASAKIAIDETIAPVLDPGRGRTKQGYFWSIARDDRPWGAADPPAIAFSYAPRGAARSTGSSCSRAIAASCNATAMPPTRRLPPPPARPLRSPSAGRIYAAGSSTSQRVTMRRSRAKRWNGSLRSMRSIRGMSADDRRRVRQDKSKPLVASLKAWFEQQPARVSGKAKIADEIRYGLNHWDGLTRFLEDGCIELDTNIVERGIRPIVLNRKNALFAGHDHGAENWACIASLIETCKLTGIEPQAYLTDVLTKLLNLWPASRLDELMPRAWAAEHSARKLAA